MKLTKEMRSAADTLEQVARLYHLGSGPDQIELSAAWLRREADVLDAPIPEGGF